MGLKKKATTAACVALLTIGGVVASGPATAGTISEARACGSTQSPGATTKRASSPSGATTLHEWLSGNTVRSKSQTTAATLSSSMVGFSSGTFKGTSIATLSVTARACVAKVS
ncbi:MAG: hypothetical protein LBH13_09530 [Cellulomonadaceae bacterium]|nr:hypothetical protein [Cellulomonadaceae bacterium]